MQKIVKQEFLKITREKWSGRGSFGYSTGEIVTDSQWLVMKCTNSKIWILIFIVLLHHFLKKLILLFWEFVANLTFTNKKLVMNFQYSHTVIKLLQFHNRSFCYDYFKECISNTKCCHIKHLSSILYLSQLKNNGIIIYNTPESSLSTLTAG